MAAADMLGRACMIRVLFFLSNCSRFVRRLRMDHAWEVRMPDEDAPADTPLPEQINKWMGRNSPFHNLLGMRIDRIDAQQAVCWLPLKEDLYHAGGVLHGGVTYALADSAVGMLVLGRLG